ncbi:MAG: CopG family transcriptional regulator [Candidatus Eisenbacteria bacterium]|uniref:CopG family transcriptional regulator n=1 Tax=Eiseniibacteriota bacterium TaxID=2212470 RepID=A0A933SCA6_UNCEI|nr:CopG family transcriptional regulator [Candidatus Eisenbacteria bacterium]
MKRTTLLLDAAVYGELKRRAALEGATLTNVVERALRIGLEHLEAPRRARVQLPSYDLGPFLADPARRDTMPGAPAEEEG